MSLVHSPQEALLLSQIVKKSELAARNKLAAREQLLRIQLILAKKAK